MPRPPARPATPRSRSVLGSAGAGSFTYTASAGEAPIASTRSPPTKPATSRRPRQPRRPRPCSTPPPPTSTASSPALLTQPIVQCLLHRIRKGGSGLAAVDLYAQAPGQTGYTKVATNTNGTGSGSFSYTATAGDGTYNFYTVATDQAGNIQATPTSPQATTLLDTTATDLDGELAGQSNTDARLRFPTPPPTTRAAPGSPRLRCTRRRPARPATQWSRPTPAATGSGSFSYTATAGDGTYSFYTVATDQAGNVQATPSSPQTTTLLDTAAPTSTATSPTYNTSGSWNVAYTASDNQGGSGLAEVDLYAKAPGQTSYTKVGSVHRQRRLGQLPLHRLHPRHLQLLHHRHRPSRQRPGHPGTPQTTTTLDTTAPTSTATSPTATNQQRHHRRLHRLRQPERLRARRG